jgi:hypothetical protein
MKRSLASLAAIVAVLICSSPAARAQGAEPDLSKAEAAKAESSHAEFSKRMFAGEVVAKKKSYACFIRRYDAAHLAQHRAQKVSAMTLLVKAEIVEDDPEVNYLFSLGVKLRNRPGKFSSGGSCGHAKVAEDENGKEYLGCGVECDGGGLSIELNEDNKSTLVKLDSIAISRDDRPNDDRRPFDGGKDDKVFKLVRVPLEQCKAMIEDDNRAVVLSE